jgi:hypothetical protein
MRKCKEISSGRKQDGCLQPLMVIKVNERCQISRFDSTELHNVRREGTVCVLRHFVQTTD